MGTTIHQLRVAQDANAAAYRRSAQTSAPGECWDFLVLTAANEKQAEGYRQELALRHRAIGPAGAFFPQIQKSLVVADPPGRRAGSGGATLGVMRALREQFGLCGEDLGRVRILLIHSGGASQRLPAYSPVGKIFAPLPLLRPDGQVSTLFDHLYVTLAGLPERLGPGMLVLAGDVFLLFDHRHVSTPAEGVTALTMAVAPELGRGHGVFVMDSEHRIARTLQKVSVEEMKSAGAMDEQGRVLIDTGLLFFDPPSTQALTEMAGSSPKSGLLKYREQIDLYDDITNALAAGTQKMVYLRAGHPAIRRELWRKLHGASFKTMLLEGEFLHLGTTRQFRDAMVGRNPSPAAELFLQNVLAETDGPVPSESRVYNSVVAGGSIGNQSVIEHSILNDCHVGDGCVVSQVRAGTSLRIPADTLFFQVPICDAGGNRLYAQVVCGVEDDFKGKFHEGKCSFLNAPIEQWMKSRRVDPEEIWPDGPKDRRTLWNARLFPASVNRDEVSWATWIAEGSKASDMMMRRWRKAPRYSMAMLLEQVDPAGLIAHREMVAGQLQGRQLLKELEADQDRPLEPLVTHYTSAAGYEAVFEELAAFSARGGKDAAAMLRQARAWWCIAQLLQRPDCPVREYRGESSDGQMRRAFGRIAEASEAGSARIEVVESKAIHLRPGMRIEAASPVRLDLSGGWSDTPPYCYERGGHVVNVAVDLNGQPPVRAMVRTLQQPVLILESQDLGQHVEIRSPKELAGRVSVSDPFALHKVALDLAGFVAQGEGNLLRHLKKLGAGMIVSTECRVPKGSGLGTSSILAATLLGALHAAAGRQVKHEELIAQTLLLEQRMGTGGGWQDQVGGIVGGVKSTRTAPGVPQRPQVAVLDLGDEQYRELQDRMVVCFSGQQRLARDILRRVMGRWLAREPAVVLLMEQLKESAEALRTALLKGRWRAAAEEIARYWSIKKQLYPGSTTPAIDVLFLELREHYAAAGLAGAGGGGFAYFFCKNVRQAARLRDELTARSSKPGALGSVFPATINRAGLCIHANPA